MSNFRYSTRARLFWLAWTVSDFLRQAVRKLNPASTDLRKSGSGTSTIPKRDGRLEAMMPLKERFDEKTVDDYLDARLSCLRLVSLYEQVCTIRARCDEEQDPDLETLEGEMVNDYLYHAAETARRLRKLEGDIPFETIKSLLMLVPEQVAKDIVTLQP